MMIYALIIGILTASSFGLPFPEEVTLLSAGFLVYMGMHPEKFPPPFPDAEPLHLHTTAIVCFFAVFISDLLVFVLGRRLGSRFLETKLSKRVIGQNNLERVISFATRHGAIAAGVFRFTPALRFPGHFSCGMLGVLTWKFCLVDGTAALISVPTQVYLIAIWGDWIVDHIKTFKLYLFSFLAIALLIYILRHLRRRNAPAISNS